MFIFGVFDWKYTLEICPKNKNCLLKNTLFSPPPSPPPLLINYWGKVFNLSLKRYTYANFFLRSHKRSGLSVVCFVLQVRVKKPTQCFLL